MSPMAAILASLALAVSVSPQDAAGWRDRSDALFAQGEFDAALEAARKAREFDDQNPWSRYAWIRAKAAVDPDAARAALPSLLHPGNVSRLSAREVATLESALGYLCLDLGLEPLAELHFNQVPPGSAQRAEAQAGLAIIALRSGDTRQALEYFEAARAAGTLNPRLAELEQDTRYRHALEQFGQARDLRDANAAARALAKLDELRPKHPSTLRARAELAQLRGDAPARERALRDLIAADPAAPDAGGMLVDNLLEQRRPAEALAVAHERAPEKLGGSAVLQAFERNWAPHVEAALAWRRREGEPGLGRLDASQLQIALVGSHLRWGRFRLAADAQAPESGRAAAGEPFGSAPALPATTRSQHDNGVGMLVHWAPRAGVVIELGHSPNGFVVDNILGALRFQMDLEGGPISIGIERTPVTDSLLSLAGATDPLTGRQWGGVVRNRAYVASSFGSEDFGVYGSFAGALLDGRQVDGNAEWEAGLGFWRRTASGAGWRANLGGNLTAFGFTDNLSRYTIGHGGYFSPSRFLSVGPTFDLRSHHESANFRIEGGLSWQLLREEASEFFPADPVLQAASGDPRYAGSSREGLGARLAAIVEWRVSNRAVAGLRLEGLRGEDYEEVRLQVYSRRWEEPVTEPLREPPLAVLPPALHDLR